MTRDSQPGAGATVDTVSAVAAWPTLMDTSLWQHCYGRRVGVLPISPTAVRLLYNIVAELRQILGALGAATSFMASGAGQAFQLLVRKTWISRSRIFLRNVLRLT